MAGLGWPFYAHGVTWSDPEERESRCQDSGRQIESALRCREGHATVHQLGNPEVKVAVESDNDEAG